MKNKILGKFTWFINQFDGIWSVPLAFIIFWIVGMLLTSIFGLATGTYDASFVQPLFLSICVVIGITNATIVGLYFTFRGLFKFLFGFKNNKGYIINHSKSLWKRLEPLHQILIAFLIFFLFFFSMLLVYLKMI